ncbi:MAG: hypothetical protein HQL35_13120 [Alphaproteobacteria bacterium]|nr:hypothetical protein [Alphaproteobacteria bacterium]
MKADDHRKVAAWHLKQAELHEANGDYGCGCPIEDREQQILDLVNAGRLEEGEACSLKKA